MALFSSDPQRKSSFDARRRDPSVRRQLSLLRDLQILVPVTDLKGGFHRTVRYRLDVAALPPRAAFKHGRQRQGSSCSNPDTGVRVKDVPAKIRGRVMSRI